MEIHLNAACFLYHHFQSYAVPSRTLPCDGSCFPVLACPTKPSAFHDRMHLSSPPLESAHSPTYFGSALPSPTSFIRARGVSLILQTVHTYPPIRRELSFQAGELGHSNTSTVRRHEGFGQAGTIAGLFSLQYGTAWEGRTLPFSVIQLARHYRNTLLL